MTIHHPSCPLRDIVQLAYCGSWPGLDHADCPSSVECQAVSLVYITSLCICPPDLALEDSLEPRDALAMGLDIQAYADKAIADMLDAATGFTGRGVGLCGAIWLDNQDQLPGGVLASLGVKA